MVALGFKAFPGDIQVGKTVLREKNIFVKRSDHEDKALD